MPTMTVARARHCRLALEAAVCDAARALVAMGEFPGVPRLARMLGWPRAHVRAVRRWATLHPDWPVDLDGDGDDRGAGDDRDRPGRPTFAVPCPAEIHEAAAAIRAEATAAHRPCRSDAADLGPVSDRVPRVYRVAMERRLRADD